MLRKELELLPFKSKIFELHKILKVSGICSYISNPKTLKCSLLVRLTIRINFIFIRTNFVDLFHSHSQSSLPRLSLFFRCSCIYARAHTHGDAEKYRFVIVTSDPFHFSLFDIRQRKRVARPYIRIPTA